jgi:hypothetical protein
MHKNAVRFQQFMSHLPDTGNIYDGAWLARN